MRRFDATDRHRWFKFDRPGLFQVKLGNAIVVMTGLPVRTGAPMGLLVRSERSGAKTGRLAANFAQGRPPLVDPEEAEPLPRSGDLKAIHATASPASDA